MAEILVRAETEEVLRGFIAGLEYVNDSSIEITKG